MVDQYPPSPRSVDEGLVSFIWVRFFTNLAMQSVVCPQQHCSSWDLLKMAFSVPGGLLNQSLHFSYIPRNLSECVSQNLL